MFSDLFLKSFRILLFPFAIVYWLIIGVRNWLYDKKIYSSVSFGLPLICVGNLSVGGTGKSPMVEYLIGHLHHHFKVATLSRGYKRKTKGYTLAGDNADALEIGDEPMQFHLKFPTVAVSVGERRIEAVPQLLHDRPETEVIILDDAYQHRSITAGLNILLTDSNNLFTRDFYIPTGDLRDLKSSYKRAEIIVVTNCRDDMSEEEKNEIIGEISPVQGQSIFFTAIEYEQTYHIKSRNPSGPFADKEVLLVSGVANPRPMKKLLEEQSKVYYQMQYPDHHIYTIDDLKDIKRRFKEIRTENKIILTTEKDAVRLIKFHRDIVTLPLYVLPIRHRFLFNEGDRFDEIIFEFIRNFKPSPLYDPARSRESLEN